MTAIPSGPKVPKMPQWQNDWPFTFASRQRVNQFRPESFRRFDSRPFLFSWVSRCHYSPFRVGTRCFRQMEHVRSNASSCSSLRDGQAVMQVPELVIRYSRYATAQVCNRNRELRRIAASQASHGCETRVFGNAFSVSVFGRSLFRNYRAYSGCIR